MEGGCGLMAPPAHEDDVDLVKVDAKIDKLDLKLSGLINELKITTEAGQRDIAQRLDFQARTDETARSGLRTDIDHVTSQVADLGRQVNSRIDAVVASVDQNRKEHATLHTTEAKSSTRNRQWGIGTWLTVVALLMAAASVLVAVLK